MENNTDPPIPAEPKKKKKVKDAAKPAPEYKPATAKGARNTPAKRLINN